MANNRELSQLASFVTVNDTTKTISIGSTVASLNIAGVVTATTFDGNLSGNLTGTTSGVNVAGVGTVTRLESTNINVGSAATISSLGVGTMRGDVSIGGDLAIAGDLLVDASGSSPITVGRGSGVGINTFNTAVGYQVLQNVTLGGIDNTGFGYRALQNVTSSTQNTGIGYSALSGITTGIGYQNTAVGYGALPVLTTTAAARGHTAIGANALSSLVTPDGVGITAVGQAAGRGMTSGQQSTIVGYGAYVYAKEGSGNVVVGNSAAEGVVGAGRTLNFSVAVGYRAMTAAGIGTTCTAVGMDSLYSGSFQNSTGIGAFAAVTGDNQVQLGNAATTVYAYGAVQDRSDSRDKADIRDTTLGLSFIGGLRPVDFKWDYRDDYASVEEYAAMTSAERDAHWSGSNKDGSRKRSRYHHGLIAQEVKAAAAAAGVDFGGYQDHGVNGGNDVLSIGYNELIGPMIKAIQELKARVEALEGG